MNNKKVSSTRSRSAKTGKFVTKSYASKHPTTTVVEAIKNSKKPPIEPRKKK